MRVLGIDTSNYTTSVSVYGGDGLESERKILDVKQGMRGIRQSDAVFIHNRELPTMIEKLLDGRTAVDAVSVSTRPRYIDGSYMPVFTVGQGYARAIAAALNIPLYEFSHQDGHIMAGAYSADKLDLLNEPFVSVHLSGGTTEILLSSFNGYNFDNTIIGGTLDISVGQLIDRVGVAMGLKFPCGKELEKLADGNAFKPKLPMSVKGAYMNLSGIETKLLRDINGINTAIAAGLFYYIRDILIKIIIAATEQTGVKKVLLVGGVASNGIIRSGLESCSEFKAYFASKELSTDNAVGIALLGYMKLKGENLL